MKRFFLICFILHFAINQIYTQTENSFKLNISYNNIELENLINELENNYGIKFIFDKERIKGIKISIDMQNATIEELMENITENKPFVYQVIQNDLIALIPIEKYAFLKGQMVDFTGALIDMSTIVIGSQNDIGKHQMVTINGKVSDGATGESIIGANIQVDNTTMGVTTNIRGMFSITLRPGMYNLIVSSIGFEKSAYKVKLLGNGNLDVELFQKSLNIDEVAVYSTRNDKNIGGSYMGLIEIDAKNFKNFPSVSGEKDIIKSMTAMPGIQSIGEFGSGINVRGGGEDQNLYLIEGAPIFNTSHMFGLLSVINPDAVSGLTIYKGNIPAQYGERVSSVMDIQFKNNNDKKLQSKGGIGIFNSRLSLEGPVSKNLTFKASGRTSYSDWLLHKLNDYYLNNSSASFYDLAGSVTYSKKYTRVSLFGYNSNDDFKYSDNMAFRYGNKLYSLNWNQTYNKNLASNLVISLSGYSNTLKKLSDATKPYELSSSISYGSVKGYFTYSGFYKHQVEMGGQIIQYNIQPGKTMGIGEVNEGITRELNQEIGIENGMFINDKYDVNDAITLNIGIRFSGYGLYGPKNVMLYEPNFARTENNIADSVIYRKGDAICSYKNFDPRASIVYRLKKNNSLKFSYNHNTQYLTLISYTSISTPYDFWKLSDSYIKPVKCDIISAGYFQNFKDNMIETSVELYYKQLKNQQECRNNAQLEMNPHIETELSNTSGTNYGIEVLIKKNTGDLQGWVSYTYSRSFRKTSSIYDQEKINNNNVYKSLYDKPNDIFVNLNYYLNRRWNISCNFTYMSGRPVSYPEYEFYSGAYKAVYYSDRNKYRLPSYNRLDLTINFYETLKIKRRWRGSWSFSVLNVYARKNAYSVFYKSEKPNVTNDFERYNFYKLYIIGKPLPTLTYNFIF